MKRFTALLKKIAICLIVGMVIIAFLVTSMPGYL